MKRLSVVAIVLLGCQEADPAGPADVEPTAAAIVANGPFPRGMMCGMSYKHGSSYWVDGICALGRTLTFQPAPGFQVAHPGDSGQIAWSGFFHQEWIGAEEPWHRSNVVAVPRGTACGMKSGCWNHANTCMGFNPSFECPVGWERKWAADMKAPAGCVFEWCEYLDPGNNCPGGNCPVPSGLTCGITDNEHQENPMRKGHCLGMRTDRDGCPAGYVRRGYYDAGRSAGRGLGWCEKV